MRTSTGLFGRAAALAELSEFVDQRIPVLVEGDAGVGKTSLVSRLGNELAAAGWDVVIAVAAEVTRPLPLVPFSLLLPEPAVDDQPGQLVALLVRSLSTRAARGRLVMVVDDVQHLDDASLAVVHQLVVLQVASVMMTRRSTDVLPDVLASMVRNGQVLRFNLAGLAPADVALLAAELSGATVDDYITADLVRWTAGNPLYLRELIVGGLEQGHVQVVDGRLALLTDDPGGDLSDLVRDRLVGLTRDDRDALELLALFDALPSRMYRSVLGEARVAELEVRRLVRHERRGRREVHVLAHPLFGESVRRSMSADDRVRAYGQHVRTVHYELNRRSDDVLNLAVASVRSGASPDATLLIPAAGIAQARSAPALVVELLTDLQNTEPTAVGAGLLGSALAGVSRLDDAIDAFEVGAAAPGDDASKTLLAVAWTVSMFAGTGEVGPSLEVLDRFRSLVSSNWRHELTAIEVMIALYAGSIADGVEMLDQMMRAPDAPERARVWALLPGGLATALAGRTADAVANGRWVVDQAPDHVSAIPDLLAQAIGVRCFAQATYGEAVDAESTLQEFLTQALRNHDAPAVDIAAIALGGIYWMMGEPRARPRGLVANQFWLGNAYIRTYAIWQSCATHARFGRLDDARLFIVDAPTHEPLAIPAWHAALAEMALAGHDRTTALAELGEAMEAARSHGEHYTVAIFEARWMGLVGDDESVHRCTAAWACADGIVADLMHRALAALQDGRLVDTLSIAAELLALSYKPLATDLAMTVDLRSSDRQVRASARRFIDQCMRRSVAQSSDALIDALTPTERKVADLVIDGLTNKMIASTLFVSSKTVEFHLTSIFRKVGVTRRTAMVKALRERDHTAG
jgi:DNA-binding CsgD family transcriptional regulator